MVLNVLNICHARLGEVTVRVYRQPVGFVSRTLGTVQALVSPAVGVDL